MFLIAYFLLAFTYATASCLVTKLCLTLCDPMDYSLPGLTQLGHNAVAFLLTRTVKNLPAMQETWVQSVDWDDPLGEGVATRSSILRSLAGYYSLYSPGYSLAMV